MELFLISMTRSEGRKEKEEEERRRRRREESSQKEKEKMRLLSKLDARDAFQRALALSFFLAFCSFYAGSLGENTCLSRNQRHAFPALVAGQRRARN